MKNIVLETVTLKRITANFVDELTWASAGAKTSLPFIVHQIPNTSLVADGEVFQAMVVGGSVSTSALVKKEKTRLAVLKVWEAALPVLETEEILLSFIVKQLDQSVRILGLNFAYPLSPVFEEGKLDGVFFMAGTKEHAFTGLRQKTVGKEIEQYVQALRNQTIRVSVANDTICLLLSGLTQYEQARLAAGIVGTGLNFAFFVESNKPVNLEAASFDKFSQSESGKIIDDRSQEKGSGVFEKEISGAYLYQHYNILSGTDAIHSTEKLNALAQKGDTLAQQLLMRSAAFVACEVAGIVLYNKRPMTFVMEGSLFWKAWKYKEQVEKYVKVLVPDYPVQFAEIADSGIYGAAKLVA